jgi:hypothetical protein
MHLFEILLSRPGLDMTEVYFTKAEAMRAVMNLKDAKPLLEQALAVRKNMLGD